MTDLFYMRGYFILFESLDKIKRNAILTVIACVLFIGACILSSVDIKPTTPSGIPLLSVILMVFAVALGIYAVKHMSTKKK